MFSYCFIKCQQNHYYSLLISSVIAFHFIWWVILPWDLEVLTGQAVHLNPALPERHTQTETIKPLSFLCSTSTTFLLSLWPTAGPGIPLKPWGPDFPGCPWAPTGPVFPMGPSKPEAPWNRQKAGWPSEAVSIQTLLFKDFLSHTHLRSFQACLSFLAWFSQVALKNRILKHFNLNLSYGCTDAQTHTPTPTQRMH